MNPSNRNNFVFVFTTILLTIFGVEMLNMALLVLRKSQAKTNCKQVPEQCPSNVRANSYSVEQRLEELNIRTM